MVESAESISLDALGLKGGRVRRPQRHRRDGRRVTAVLTWQRGGLARFSLLNAGE